jgi:predicted LPLAT superfamily acyltransferase
VSRRWAQLQERGSTTALHLIHWIGVRIGRWAGRFLLYPITLYYVLIAVPQRQASRLYLRRVLHREPHWLDIFRHIHCYAATILDRVYLLTGQFERFDIRIHQGHLILDQMQSGQGCLLLGAHLGSFEVTRVLGVTSRRFPLKILMNVAHNRRMTQFMDALNPELAATIIPIDGPDTLLGVKDHLDRGYLVGALGDRILHDEKAVRCRFFGAQARFPSGPLLLAALTGCPVILFFGLYRGGNRYDIYFERLADSITLDRSRRQQELHYWTQRYAERLEHYTRSAPYNWFNFYDFWEDT